MHLEVLIGAVAKKLRAARPEVGESGDVLLGRRGGCLVEVDHGHACSFHGRCHIKVRNGFIKNQRLGLTRRPDLKRPVVVTSAALGSPAMHIWRRGTVSELDT